MSTKSTDDRYGSVAIAIHWLSAAGIVGALAIGVIAAGIVDPEAKVVLVRGHIVLGSAVLLLTLMRIAWWLLADRHPRPVGNQPAWQQAAASAVHGLLYVVILVMASSGIATIILSGAMPALIAGTALPDFGLVLPRAVHGVASRIMLALLAAHIGAALFHQYVRRDRLLGRMGLGPV